MRANQVTFSFHNRLGLALDAIDSQAVDFFRSELAFAEGEFGADLPFVRLGWMTSSEEKELRAPLIPASHKMLARWRYGINMNQSVVHLRVAGNSISIPIVFHSMVLPSLRLLAASAGEILLHGAAVVKSGQSIILTGKSGIGKTTVSTVLLDFGGEDWALHADDYVFIDSELTTHAFLTRTHLYRQLLHWSPDVVRRLSLWDRLRLEFLGLIRGSTRDRLMWPLRIPGSHLWPGRTAPGSASLSAIVILRPGRGSSAHLRPLPRGEGPIRELQAINLSAASKFVQLAGRCQGLPDHWAQEWQSQEVSLLTKFEPSVPIYELTLPREPDPQPLVQEQIAGLLNAIVSRRA